MESAWGCRRKLRRQGDSSKLEFLAAQLGPKAAQTATRGEEPQVSGGFLTVGTGLERAALNH